MAVAVEAVLGKEKTGYVEDENESSRNTPV